MQKLIINGFGRFHFTNIILFGSIHPQLSSLKPVGRCFPLPAVMGCQPILTRTGPNQKELKEAESHAYAVVALEVQ